MRFYRDATQRATGSSIVVWPEVAIPSVTDRVEGYIESLDDLEQVAIGSDGRGTPVLLQDVGDVHLGPELRRGLTDLNGDVVNRYAYDAFGRTIMESGVTWPGRSWSIEISVPTNRNASAIRCPYRSSPTNPANAHATFHFDSK